MAHLLIRRLRHCAYLRKLSTASFVQKKLSEDALKLGVNDEGIALIGINRPEAKNSLSFGFITVLQEIIEHLSNDSSLRVAIIRSEVPGVFCAGADLKERAKISEEDVPKFVSKARNLFQQLSEVPIPTIAAIDGAALGGGLELALACDLRVGSDNAKIGLTETKLAIIPGAGGTQRLPRLIGISKAKELMYTGKALNGIEAEKIGLVDYGVKQNDDGNAAFIKAMEMAKKILPQGPVAVRMVKKAINEGLQGHIKDGLSIEEECYAQVVPTKDRIEGLKAFKEKRRPQYTGQ